MRFYAKLGMLSLVFVALSWLSGAAGRAHAKDWYFAARCQIAVTLSDAALEQRLLDEARQELRNAARVEGAPLADAVAVAFDREDYVGR